MGQRAETNKATKGNHPAEAKSISKHMARYPLTDRMGDSKSVAGSPTHDHISFPNTFF